MKKELDIDGYKITVTDDGRVFHNGIERKQSTYQEGYKYIAIKGKNYLIHRLVASAFIQPLERGDRSIHVHHKDENKANNNLSNLEILSVEKHQHEHKQIYPLTKKCVVCGKEFTPHETKRKRTQTCSEECHKKLMRIKSQSWQKPVIQKDLNNNFIKRWDCMTDVAKYLDVDVSLIIYYCNHPNCSSSGFKWEYALNNKELAYAE